MITIKEAEEILKKEYHVDNFLYVVDELLLPDFKTEKNEVQFNNNIFESQLNNDNLTLFLRMFSPGSTVNINPANIRFVNNNASNASNANNTNNTRNANNIHNPTGNPPRPPPRNNNHSVDIIDLVSDSDSEDNTDHNRRNSNSITVQNPVRHSSTTNANNNFDKNVCIIDISDYHCLFELLIFKSKQKLINGHS